MRRQDTIRDRRRKITIAAVAVVVVAGAAAGITVAVQNSGSGSIAGVRSFSGLSRNHVEGTVKYPQTPPVGGNHNPVWLNCGIYDKPVANENAVHDLEHGAVWITYQPSLPADQLATLKKLVGGQTYLDLSPYPGLPTPVVASAWGKQLTLQKANDPRLAKFVAKYKQGPQTLEPGAACSGGTGTPTG